MKVNRSNFLKISLLSAVSALISNCNTQSEVTAKDKALDDVIVIGAGIAGLSAASSLKAQGYRVVVLEGRDRIGGRIWTDRSWQGIPLDMGASWIHGVDRNPISALAQKFNLTTLPTDYSSNILYDREGNRLSDAAQDQIDRRFTQVIEQLDRLRKSMDAAEKPDISLEIAISEIIRKMNLDRYELEELNYSIATSIEHEYATDISDLSLFNWDRAGDLEGGDRLFPDGYDRIVQGLAGNLEIRLGQIVKQVTYSDRGVEVVTNRGKFQADRAVITLPLGVLKNGSVQFSPPLPSQKVKAIQALNMGVLNKVYLRFAQVFWAQNPHLLNYISTNKGEWSEFLNIAKYTQKPVLLGFNAGTYGISIEKLSDRQIVSEVMQVLRKIYGGSIPEPEAWLITRWGSDPFAGGSYSHTPPGASSADYDALAQPVVDRLFFAGESTSNQHPATVHGAFWSGEREAKRIVTLAKKT